MSLLLFSILTVKVDARSLAQVRSRAYPEAVPLSEIESHSAVRNPWYYGWGLRRTPIGWLYNVSGLEAVEITMKDGRKVRIGTDDPAGLDAAIGAALSNKRV